MMVTLADPDSLSLQTVTPDFVWLEQQLRKSPTDVRLAHDMGLAHYWQAKLSGEETACVLHWQYVIANWAMVLQSESFWQGWARERSQVYEQKIETEQQGKAHAELEKRLMVELDEFERQHPEARPPLKLSYVLECKAILLLRKTYGFRLFDSLGESLYCGPTMLRQLELQTASGTFFKEQALTSRDPQASLRFILSSIRGYVPKQTPASDPNHQLRLCYSALGLAWVSMEQGNPQLALELLTDQQCPICHPELRETKEGSSLERCQEGCLHFIAKNPAYAAIQHGQEFYIAEAAELFARAHVLWAEQCLAQGDVSALFVHFRQALKAAQKLGIQESLRQQFGQLLLQWVEEPLRDKRWDDVIALLDNAGEFEESGTWRSKLSLAYDQRGVTQANNEEWERSCDDLRQACKLAPYDQRIRQNLLDALKGYERATRRSKNDDLCARLGEEIKRVDKGDLPNTATIVEPLPP